MANQTCNPAVITQALGIQATGPRTVIVPADPIIWDEGTSYEYLTLVASTDFGQGYISKRDVPSGTPLTNTEYWIPVASFNAQLAQIQQQTAVLENKVNESTAGYVNLVAYGADITGTNDSTDAINRAIADNQGKNIIFNPGTYRISGQVVTPFTPRTSIDFNGSKLISDSNSSLESAIAIGFLNVGSDYSQGSPSIFRNATITVTGNATYAISVHSKYLTCRIENIYIYTTGNGIKLGDSSPIDAYVDNCLISKDKESAFTHSVGIDMGGTDANINECRVYGFETGCILSGGSTASNCHFMGYSNNDQTEMVGILCNGVAMVSNYYNDNIRTALKLAANANVTAANIFDYAYKAIGDRIMFDCSEGTSNLKLSACGIVISSNFKGDTYTTVKYPNQYTDIGFKQIKVANANVLSNNLVFFDVTKRLEATNVSNVSANEWNRLCSFAIGDYGSVNLIILTTEYGVSTRATYNGSTLTIKNNALYGTAPSTGANKLTSYDTLGTNGIAYFAFYIKQTFAQAPIVIVGDSAKSFVINDSYYFHGPETTSSDPQYIGK